MIFYHALSVKSLLEMKLILNVVMLVIMELPLIYWYMAADEVHVDFDVNLMMMILSLITVLMRLMLMPLLSLVLMLLLRFGWY